MIDRSVAGSIGRLSTGGIPRGRNFPCGRLCQWRKNMKLKQKIKSITARTLVLALGMSTLSPGMPALAEGNSRDQENLRKIIFDPDEGPDLKHAEQSGYGTRTGLDGFDPRLTVLQGPEGKIIADIYGAAAGFPVIHEDTLGYDRLVMPSYPETDPNTGTPLWDGYSFAGWYKDKSYTTKLGKMPAAFPYDNDQTYYARWLGNSTTKYNLRVIHYRDLDPTRAALGNDNTDAWILDENGGVKQNAQTNTIQFFTDSWTKEQSADSQIAGSPRGNIPGYKLDTEHDVLIRNYQRLDFSKNEITEHYTDTGDMLQTDGVAYISRENHALKGTMPNTDLTVAYRYVPDTAQTFPLRIEYVDQSGMTIHEPTLRQYSAEASIDTSPAPDIDAAIYTLKAGEITAGKEGDGKQNGVYGTDKAGWTQDSSSHIFSGKMPNRPVTVRYVYDFNSSYESKLSIQLVDENGDLLSNDVVSDNWLSGVDGAVINGSTHASATVTRSLQNNTITLTLPDLTAQGYGAPQPQPEGGFIQDQYTYDQASRRVTIALGTTASTLTVPYVMDAQSSVWGTVYYQSGTNGRIELKTGDADTDIGTVPNNRLVKTAAYHVPDFLTYSQRDESGVSQMVSVTPVPDPGYRFDGWYSANASLQTGQSPLYQTDATGSVVRNEEVNLGDGAKYPGRVLRLQAKFVRDETQFITVRFIAGQGGNISGQSTLTLNKALHQNTMGTQNPSEDPNVAGDEYLMNPLWPQATPDQDHLFVGWMDERGKMITDRQYVLISPAEFQDSQTYTAIFRPISSDADTLLMPQTEGSINSNTGFGQIRLQDVNQQRKYAVADESGKVVKLEPGTLIRDNQNMITEIVPGALYNVYELKLTSQIEVGGDIGALQSGIDRSEGSAVELSTLGSNYTVTTERDSVNSKLTIRAARDVFYTVYPVDRDTQEEESGWKKAGTDGKIVFEVPGGRDYYVVASTSENEDPSSRESYASVIFVQTALETKDPFTFSVTGGGKIVGLHHENTDDQFENFTAHGFNDPNAREQVTFHQGDAVEIDAPEFYNNDPSTGRRFQFWNLQGSVPDGVNLGRRSQRISNLGRGNILLQAVYEADSSGDKWYNKIEIWTMGDGKLSIDMSEENLADLREKLASASTPSNADHTTLTQDPSAKIRYNINFRRRTSGAKLASASAAVKDAATFDTDPQKMKTPWLLEVSLTKTVDGVTKEISGEQKRLTELFLAADNTVSSGNVDYRMWHITSDEDGQLQAASMPLFGENPRDTGSFSFEGQLDGDYMISYQKGYKVVIHDIGAGTTGLTWTFGAAEGESITDAIEREQLDIPPLSSSEDYIIIQGAKRMKFDGLVPASRLGRNSRSVSGAIDPNDEVTRDLELWTHYTEAPEDGWNEAMQKLADEIDRGNALLGNAEVTQDDRDKLQSAVNAATAFRNEALTTQYRSPAEILAQYEALKEVIDGITSGGNHGGNSGDHGGNSGGGSTGGGGGGGGSLGLGARRSVGSDGNAVYTSGVDGNWVQDPVVLDRWKFELMDGSKLTNTFATIIYAPLGTAARRETYHFDAEGVMNAGWYRDADGKWYQFSTEHDGFYGHLKKGWFLDPASGYWYYLDLISGEMHTGWTGVGTDRYYLTPQPNMGQPLGSMWAAKTTPDGETVGADGAWIRKTPEP